MPDPMTDPEIKALLDWATPGQPHNAGQSIRVGPVAPIDFGTITVTENWGRLFLTKEAGATLVVAASAYADLRNAIDHFIDTAALDLARLALSRGEALAAAQAENARLREALIAITVIEPEPIGDTMFFTGPAAHFGAAQRIARAALRGTP